MAVGRVRRELERIGALAPDEAQPGQQVGLLIDTTSVAADGKEGRG